MAIKIKTSLTVGVFYFKLHLAGTTNEPIDEGIAKSYKLYNCQYFNHQCHMTQYFNCSQYRHIFISFCEENVSGECLSKSHYLFYFLRERMFIGLLYKSAHTAWDKQCEYQKNKIERI